MDQENEGKLDINELNRLALQKKLSIPGSDYSKDRQQWVNDEPEKILDRIEEIREQEKN